MKFVSVLAVLADGRCTTTVPRAGSVRVHLVAHRANVAMTVNSARCTEIRAAYVLSRTGRHTGGHHAPVITA
jgi:hypothetical protein